MRAYRGGMASLSDLSRDIAAILDRAAPGIVRVDARRGRPATGIVWGNNLVVSADHVIEHDDAIQVSAGGTSVKATVAGRDPGTDLALLKTDGLTASPLARAASTEVRTRRTPHEMSKPTPPGEITPPDSTSVAQTPPIGKP